MEKKKVGQWVSLTIANGTIIRVRRVPWRTKLSDGSWVNSENVAVVIQRIKDNVESFKIDEPEAIALMEILKEVFA